MREKRVTRRRSPRSPIARCSGVQDKRSPSKRAMHIDAGA
nr:MAG TPA: hypothetical protein [Caudoviricetes sp.]DAW61893.1 MAG TPA: hypothetical protein [Caudoviricetes sp.]